VRARALVASVAGGLVGGLLGAAVMSAGHAVMSPLIVRDAPPRSDDARAEDSTVTVADTLSTLVRKRPLVESEKPLAGQLVHYGFGAAMGLVYGVGAVVSRVVTLGMGIGFGAAVWAGAHATVVPALGLAPSPLREPLAKEALELLLHLAYGLTVGVVHRVAVRTSR
jgi:uncharacterized membrane protein YagU involved in acid resistance